MDASAISSDNYGMESMQVAVMKKAQNQNAEMAVELIQDAAQNNQEINANAPSANPGERVGQHINISA